MSFNHLHVSVYLLGHQPDIVLEGFDGPGSYIHDLGDHDVCVSLPETPSSRTDTRPRRAARHRSGSAQALGGTPGKKKMGDGIPR